MLQVKLTVMNFSFDAKSLKAKLHGIVADVLHDDAINNGTLDARNMSSFNDMVAAMEQAIDVMHSADYSGTNQQVGERYIGGLQAEDVSRIGGYALELIENLAVFLQNISGEQNMDLTDMSLPVSLWVAEHGGRLSQIDMQVNSLAAYANKTTDTQKLVELSTVMKEIINACDDEIRRDVDQSNRMRPWRILNLNYGIVATRSHQPEIIEQAYDTLIKNLPQDARNFFREGAQQMDIVGYPDEVRAVVERYNKMWGSDSSLH